MLILIFKNLLSQSKVALIICARIKAIHIKFSLTYTKFDLAEESCLLAWNHWETPGGFSGILQCVWNFLFRSKHYILQKTTKIQVKHVTNLQQCSKELRVHMKSGQTTSAGSHALEAVKNWDSHWISQCPQL